jgi:signal peptidase I
VLYSPVDGKRLVKRVIGEPDDRLALVDNCLYVNGAPATYEPLPEEIKDEIPLSEQTSYEFAREVIGDQSYPVMVTPGRYALRSYGPVIVPEGHYFVMGDNRDNSSDSRLESFGFVERRLILGRATATVMSVDPSNYYLPRWRRFFRGLP